MTFEKSIEEARILKDKLSELQVSVYYLPEFKDSEVEFRRVTLKGFITIMQNDVSEMICQWVKELQEASK